MSSSKPLTSQSVETHHLTNSRPRASKITTMLWRAVERQLPGAHRTQPFSIFAGLEKPAIAKLVSCNPDHLPPGKSPETILLDGRWERCIDPDQATTRSVAFAMPSTKTTWEPTKVPQNYGLESDLQFYFGPLWYRRTITRPAEALWVDLHFEAVDYLADVVLNGEYLGRHEGYFAPFAFDLSEKLAEGEQAELIVRVQDPLENLKDKGISDSDLTIPPESELEIQDFILPDTIVNDITTSNDSGVSDEESVSVEEIVEENGLLEDLPTGDDGNNLALIAYIDAAAALGEKITETGEKFAESAIAYSQNELTLDEFRDEFLSFAPKIKAIIQEFGNLMPPPDAEPIHQKLVDGLDQCNQAVELMGKWFDNPDSGTKEVAALLVASCISQVNAAGEELQELVNEN